MTFVDGVIAWIASLPFSLAVALVFVVVAAKYVFPPVPTDLVSVITAFLAGKLGWLLWPLVLAYLAGSATGILLAHRLGIWLAGMETWPRLIERFRPQLDKVVDQFRARGLRLVATNRFLPVVRDFAIVAAGLADLPRRDVLLWGVASSTAWVAVVFGIGATAGQNWSVVVDRFSRLGTATWVLAAAGAIALLVGRWLRLRKG